MLDYDSILSDVHYPLVLHIDGFSEVNVGHRNHMKSDASADARIRIIWKMAVILHLVKALIWSR